MNDAKIMGVREMEDEGEGFAEIWLERRRERLRLSRASNQDTPMVIRDEVHWSLKIFIGVLYGFFKQLRLGIMGKLVIR